MSIISELMQSFTMSSPKRAKLFLSKMRPSFFEKKGKRKAMDSFLETAKEIVAYQSFLESKNFKVESVRSTGNFKKIPIIDKKTYIERFSLEKRCVGGDLSQMYAISSSSGAGGQPMYWPRTAESDSIIPQAMNLLLSDIIHTERKSTLIVITLGMGLWSAGDSCTFGCRKLASEDKYRLTVVTPGLRVRDTLDIIKRIGRRYDQILLIGYPPFIKDIIEIGERKKVDWKNLSTKILIGGEGVSEKWRDYILKKIGSKKLYDVCNLFATAEAGILAFETPFSIILRRIVEKKKRLNKKLFDSKDAVSVVQYNPMAKFLEDVEGEIVLTSAGAVPLVRYNMHDRGKILSFTKILKILEEEKVDIENEMKKYGYEFGKVFRLPVLVANGRSDGIHFYAVNIYRENVMTVLEDVKIAESVTGRFKMSTIEDKKANQIFIIKVELTKGEKSTERLKNKIRKVIHEGICKLNSEYNELSKYLSTKAKGRYLPEVEVYSYKDSKYFRSYKIKHRYI